MAPRADTRQRPSALIAFGSETGNAEDYAEEIARALRRLYIETSVSELDTVNLSTLTGFSFVIIIISTTGQGDLPSNSKIFWRSLLRKKLSDDVLVALSFTVFGLGDSSYPKFNWAALKVHKRLTQLGGHEFFPRGEADEQHEEGLDGSFAPWLSELRRRLLESHPLAEGVFPIPDDALLAPDWLLTFASDSSESPHTTDESKRDAVREPAILQDRSLAPTTKANRGIRDRLLNGQKIETVLESNQRLTPQGHWQDVRHMVFSSKVASLYDPGDVLSINPQNPASTVDELIARMRWDNVANKFVKFERQSPSERVNAQSVPPVQICSNVPTTLRQLLTDFLDITAVPRRSFFALAASFTSNQDHKDRLVEFTQPEYVDELYDYTTRPRRSILEVLQEFDSIQIPWIWAANAFPKLRPRQFSIASGGKLKQGPDGGSRFELLVAIVKYKTVIKRIREGVCTRYLANLKPGTSLVVTLQKGHLGLSPKPSQPVLLVGPGTGIAPIRSLMWERLSAAADARAKTKPTNGDDHSTDSTPACHLLFFGNRNRVSDYFFKEDWENIGQEVPLQVFTAFSRDQEGKIYVQDRIRQQSALVFDMLHNRGAMIFVCGSSGKMPQAVRTALAEAMETHGDMDAESAKKYVEQLEKEGRYKQETW